MIEKRRVCSYILETYLPTTIQEVLSAQGGRAKHKELAHLSQKEICTDVPTAVHPYTATEVKSSCKVLSYFQPSQSYKRMRIASSEEDNDHTQMDVSTDYSSDVENNDESPAKKNRRSFNPPALITIANGYVPRGIESHIKTMIVELNEVYLSLSNVEKRRPGDVVEAYRVKLQQKSSMWLTKDVPETFPFHRFKHYSVVLTHLHLSH